MAVTAPARAPSVPRRRSGPARPLPPRPPGPQRARGARALDRLLRGRAWVVLIAVLLAGIVFLNVDLLEINQGIASTDQKAQTLEQTNSVLRYRLAKVQSAGEIQHSAESLGYVLPEPGDVTYLRPRASDARVAAARLASASTVPSWNAASSAMGTTPLGAAGSPSGTR